MDSRTLTHVAYGLLAVGVLWLALRPRQAAGRIGTGTVGTQPLTLPHFPTMSPTPAQPKITANTLAFIRAREGLRLTPYSDGPGYSIGYGHFLGTKAPPAGTTITKQQAEDWLLQDASGAAKSIYSLVKVPLSQNQFDALVSFVYNIGADDFRSSTLLNKLNAGDYTGAADQFRRWVYSGQTVLKDLINRRALERDLFTTA